MNTVPAIPATALAVRVTQGRTLAALAGAVATRATSAVGAGAVGAATRREPGLICGMARAGPGVGVRVVTSCWACLVLTVIVEAGAASWAKALAEI